jgi:hypothetical protein
MPLTVGLVVVGLWSRLRWRSVRSRVLLRPVLRRRIALPLIGRGAILRTVLLLLLRGRSVLILLRRILLLRTWIAIRVRAIRIGIGVVRGSVIAAVIGISIPVRIAIVSTVVGITESEAKSERATSTTVAEASAVTVAAATIAAVATAEASNSTAAIASYASSSVTSADRTTAEATATAYGMPTAATSTMPAAPLGETRSSEYQRDECDLQRAHRKLLNPTFSDYRTLHTSVRIPEFYRGIISFSTYLPIKSTSTLIAAPCR